jgi:hypothetical protein
MPTQYTGSGYEQHRNAVINGGRPPNKRAYTLWLLCPLQCGWRAPTKWAIAQGRKAAAAVDRYLTEVVEARSLSSLSAAVK